MALPRPSSPRAVWIDLKLFWQGRTRTQWWAAALAVLIPVVIAILFYLDGRTNIAPGPQVIFVESWPAERTDAEIRAKQQVDLRARQARERARQQEFQQLDNSLSRLGL